ncbi:LacI family DNA-binding transcriptional regulator [Microlunatus parietis]|uniref:DNA-binding LacI/PurR family transcriptional regulator n=1 Tax=Microlunatus parietis TaxID=682979 RepID=A0A7Y9LCE0_9ACTN|nr:LacI family DNA-binding transcriptional regulator [Microlunatus parietis]NYE71610.1 DNA-binding LacI/PurR family transcriptional regulator [Microlunatus parietis]
MPKKPEPSRPRRVTIRDVAERAGVSPSAVSHTFNGRADIGAVTRERILAAARDLNWRPAAAALALAAARTQTIGYLVNRDPVRVRSDPFFVDILAGMQSVLAPAHYNVLARIVSSRDEELEAYRNLTQRRQVDGFVLVDHQDSDPRYAIIRDAGLPAVAVGRTPAECPFPAVASAPDEPGLREAVTVLAGLGHRRIAYIGGPAEFAYSQFRLQRVENAADEAGLELLLRSCSFAQPEVARVTRELLGLAARPTAILFSNDWMAIWGMAEAQDAGLNVPDDLSVVGHDDAPFAALARPALASVQEDVVQLADLAARTLLSLIAGDEPEPAEPPPTVFLARDSVAGPPARLR